MKTEKSNGGEVMVKLSFRLTPNELAAAWWAGTVILPRYAGWTQHEIVQLAERLPKTTIVDTARKILRREGLKGVDRWLDDSDLRETLDVIASVFMGRFCMKI